MTTLKQDPLLLGVLLIGGAILYTRAMKANAAPGIRASGATSVPGNVGSGTQQIVGGLLGSLMNGMGFAKVTNPGPSAMDPYYLGVSTPVQEIARTGLDLNLPGVEVFGDQVLFIDP